MEARLGRACSLAPCPPPTHPPLPRFHDVCALGEKVHLRAQGELPTPHFQSTGPLSGPVAPPETQNQEEFESSATLFQSRNKSFPSNKYKKNNNKLSFEKKNTEQKQNQ